MSAAGLRRRIDEALADRRLVRIVRRKRWDRLDGAIVARSAKWLVLASEHDAGFDGHVLLRVGDVRRVEPYPVGSFVPRALALDGHWPLPGLDGVDLTSTRRLLASLAATQPMVGVHDEHHHPDELLIGLPRSFRRKKFGLRNVGIDAGWDSADATLTYRSVSRIDVGNGYERRLAAVVGPPPQN